MGIRIPLEDHRADARALLDAHRRRERVPVDAGLLGRVVASDVRALVDVPSVDNSQMDGFALAAADVREAGVEVTLTLAPTIAAGDPVGEHRAGTATPIMTGAAVPRGADLVVPVEESAEGRFAATPETGQPVTLVPQEVRSGRFVRRKASDTVSGDVILREGATLTPARIAHLAACGVPAVNVLAPMRALVLSTGSEVQDSSTSLQEGGAFDANGPGISAALAEAGVEVIGSGRVVDDPEQLLESIARMIAETGADLLVTSGGVSAGAFEVVRQVSGRDGVRLAFPKVAMQPGGPQGIGTVEADGRRIPWIAVPGNPVSALLSIELIVRPALRAPERARLRLPVQLEEDQPSPSALDQFRRARLLPGGGVRLVSGPSSHLLGALALSDALVRIPAGVDVVHDGDMLETILLPMAGGTS